MGTAKVAITIETQTLREIHRLVKTGRFPNRSRAIQTALAEMTARYRRRRLIEELAKLDPRKEQALADQSFAGEVLWPQY